MKVKKHLIYVGDFRFPDGDAGGRRVYGIGLALRDAGYTITFAGAEAEGRDEDRVNGNRYYYKDFRYLPAGVTGESLINRAWRLYYVHASGASTISRIERSITPSTVGIICYQALSPALIRIRRYCRRKGLFLVADVVEWYDRGHVGGGRIGPFAVDSEIRMRCLLSKTDGMIVISRFLEEHYSKSLRFVLRVPPLIDAQEESWRPAVNGDSFGAPIKIAFVGNAGKKDLVTQAIRGLDLLGPEANRFRLSIVGPSLRELRSSLGNDSGILDRRTELIDVFGKLPRDHAVRILAAADFTFLLRRDARFSKAGFPTKLVESLAMGVPVITNITGDIGSYVNDGIEGIIVDDPSAEAFAASLTRILMLNVDMRGQMRRAARRRALESFDYRKWVTTLGGFFDCLSVKS